MSKRHRSRSSSSGLIGLIKQDQFGSLWLSLLLLAMMIVKWYVLSPITIEGAPCVACAVLLLWLIMIIFSLLITAVWWAWDNKMHMGIAFMLVLPLYIVGCAWLADYIARALFQKLYQSGLLTWPEVEITFLLDDFIRHNVGLFLGTAVIYSMIRLFISRDLRDKKVVIPVGVGICLATSGLMFIGIKLY